MQQQALTAILCLWIGSLSLQAACIGPGSARDVVQIGDVTLFVGRAVSITEEQDIDEIGNESFKQLRVHFAVLERFPLLESPVREADVLTRAKEPSFGYRFEVGSTYLVFAEHKEGNLVTSRCHGTKLLSEAGEDLAYLRSIPRLRQTGEINGYVQGGHASSEGWTWAPPWVYTLAQHLLPPDLERRLLRGMPLRLDGGGHSYFAVTDGGGGFHFSNLPPGIYSLHLEQKNLNFDYNRPIRAVPGSNRNLWLHVDVSRSVEGTVMTIAGNGAKDVDVDLVQVSEKRAYWRRGATTDEHGHFEIKNVAPGTYYLGVSAGRPPSLKHPYNTWYYPGTPNLTRAATIQFGSQPETQKASFTLPPALASDVVKVLVFAPDGQPVRDADVYVRDVQSGSESTPRCCSATTGTIAFRAFEKRSYRMMALASLGAEPWMTKPLIINFDASTPRTLKLMLSEHGEQKRQETIEQWWSVY